MHTEITSPITLTHRLFGIFDWYLEFATRSSEEEDSPTLNWFNAEITARTSEDTQVDFGCYFGLNAATAPYNCFAGYSIRM